MKRSVTLSSLSLGMILLFSPNTALAEGAAEQSKLIAGDPNADDRFGSSVALASDIALVGSPLDDERATDAGAVYVFRRINEKWTQQAKLTASDAYIGDRFGRSIAISGNLALIGAPLKNDGAGVVYLFERTNTVWTEKARIAASDARAGHEFGISVAIDRDTILIGATFHNHAGDDTGMAYVFVREDDTVLEQSRLMAEDATAESEFGRSVAIEGRLALVGAPGSGENRTMAGSAYLFESDGDSWRQVAKLTPEDSEAGNDFGYAVAIDQRTALVGSFHDSQEKPSAGAAYLFAEGGSKWVQQDKLVVRDAKADDHFGYALSLRAGAAVIGAQLNDHMGDSAGAAFLFVKNREGWQERSRITADDGSDFDNLGGSVAIDENTLLIGAHLHSSAANGAGAAYVYLFERLEGDACESSQQCAQGLCVNGYCCRRNCQENDASWPTVPEDAGRSESDAEVCAPADENNGCGCHLIGSSSISRTGAWYFIALMVVIAISRLRRKLTI